MTPTRLAKVVLAILGVWGLLAGLMLIRTLLATEQIRQNVATMTTTLSDIDRDTGSIALMQETNRLSAELLAASQPLPGSLGSLATVTADLAGKVDSILVGSTTIEQNTTAIEERVVTARATAAAINGSVRGIDGSLAAILTTLRSTQQAAAEINASTRGINTAVAAMLPVTKEIDAGIASTNRGIVDAGAFVAAIRADVGNILAALPDVLKHARSIDCSSGLGLLGVLRGAGEAC